MRGKFFYGSPLYVFKADAERHFDASQAAYLVNSLLAFGQVAFQIVARPQGIRWQVLDLSGKRTALSTLKFPQVQVESVAFASGKPRSYPFQRGKIAYRLYNSDEQPLLYIDELYGEADPLLPLIQTLSYLQEGEEICYTLLVARQYKPTRYITKAFINDILTVGTFDRYLNSSEQFIQHKQNQLWYECFIGVDIDSPNFQRVYELRQAINFQISGAFDRYSVNQPSNGLRSRTYPQIFKVKSREEDYRTSVIGWYERGLSEERIKTWWADHWTYLIASEIASLWHLPHKHFTHNNILWAKFQPALPRDMATNREGIILGKAIYQDKKVVARLHQRDRDIHTTIVGRTGSGKSTLMYHLIQQDIQNGSGVFVLDPPGHLVKAILQTSIPKEREQDVVVLDFAQDDYPIPLNLFAGEQSYAAIGRVVDIIERFYDTTGVRMDRYLRAAITALQIVPKATMLDVFYLLTDQAYRRDILSKVSNSLTLQTLDDEFEQLKENERRIIRNPILNRIDLFYANEKLRPHLCHPHRFNLQRFIDEQKIVLISLDVEGENVPQKEHDLVGALLISLLQMIGMKPSNKTAKFYVYIDEVQNFITSSLDKVFAGARKYDLSMTVSHQQFSQLPSETLQSILTNVGTIAAFAVNADDAQKLAANMQPQFNTEDLVKLSRFQAATKMLYDGEAQDAFKLFIDPIPPMPPDGYEREKRIRQLSIQQYTPMSRDEVSRWFQQRYPKFKSMTIPVRPREETWERDDLDYEDFTG